MTLIDKFSSRNYIDFLWNEISVGPNNHVLGKQMDGGGSVAAYREMLTSTQKADSAL